MIVLALVLLLIVALAVVGVVLSAPTVHDFSSFRIHIPVTNAGMFLAGAAAMLLAVIAVVLIRTVARRARARRQEAKALGAGRVTAKPSKKSSVAVPADSGPATRAPSSRKGAVEPPTDSAERTRLLAEADALTRDDPPR